MVRVQPINFDQAGKMNFGGAAWGSVHGVGCTPGGWLEALAAGVWGVRRGAYGGAWGKGLLRTLHARMAGRRL